VFIHRPRPVGQGFRSGVRLTHCGAPAAAAFARTIKRSESRHLWCFIALVFALMAFGIVLFTAGDKLGGVVGPKLQELEASSSP
jgi:hypothetical protein